MVRYAFLDAPLPLAFAHRGAGNAVENSMAAFEAVVALGYRYLETDVRATADGALLAFHDATLDRVTDRRGAVADMAYAEVAKARIRGAEPIPLLADLLNAYPELRFNLDVKAGNAVRPLVELIRDLGALDRVCVGSFSDARLAAVRAGLGPRLCTSLAPREAVRMRLGRYHGGAGCVQVPARFGRLRITDAGLVRAAHRHDLQVHVWTVNEEVEMNRLLDLGVDGIMTDQADLLRSVLTARGAWH
jgi:glycerophosphoryl diester phosphodiesterase